MAQPRYALEHRVGVGGVAEVFRARCEAGGSVRTVAVKRIRPDQAASGALRDRLLDESRIAARLVHPCIVALLDSYQSDGTLHLVMEYVDGISVEQLIARAMDGAFIPATVSAHIIREVARALDHAHKQGVLHRDVSASNVLVSVAGEVKLSDFGLADAAGRISTTEPGQVIGKWTYLSPRRQRGEPATPRDDLYAVGVLIERLLASADPRDRAREHSGLDRLRQRLMDDTVVSSAAGVMAELPENGGAAALASLLRQPLPRRRRPPSAADLQATTLPRPK